jgi:hypothetical protein
VLPTHVLSNAPAPAAGSWVGGHLRCQVRFDDTNPSKEKDEFVENIIKDMQVLGLKYNTITYTSDYFPQVGKKTQQHTDQHSCKVS